MTKKEYWFWLCNLNHFGIKKIQAVLDVYGTPEQAFYDDMKDLNSIKILTERDRTVFRESRNCIKIEENYAKLAPKGIYFVTKEDSEYPGKLREIYDSPHALYVKGKLPDPARITIAVVGARNCSDYGMEAAGYFSEELARAGIQIVSGLARGIDGYSHRGALAADGSTFAVEGCGVDICYPKENFSLYMDMQSKGGVISEYGLGISPKAGNFPMRNRLISGLSDGILVIEAKERSGSFITVDMGLEQGKNIYAIPGRINDSLSKGSNNLIKMGAKLVSEVTDILEDYRNLNDFKEKEMKNIDKLLESKEKIVYACLSLLPKHINEIAGETNISIAELTEILLNLELKNFVKQIRKNYFSNRSWT